MVSVKHIIEIVQEVELKKIRVITEKDEYAEIRQKDGWLDVRVSRTEGDSLRAIFRERLNKELSINEMIERLDILFL